MDPVTGRQLACCPFLRKDPELEKYSCDIYHDRPEDCKHYPINIAQMVQDECEMLEVRYLTKPKQAQKILDIIMSDSRQPYA